MQLREDQLTAAEHPKYTCIATQLNSKLTAAATSHVLFTGNAIHVMLTDDQDYISSLCLQISYCCWRLSFTLFVGGSVTITT